MNTHDARRLTPETQENLRRRVVQAVLHQGLSRAQAVRTFQVGRTSLYYWLKAYEANGVKALRSRRRGRPRRSRLHGHQAALLVRLIIHRCPEQLQLPWTLWTREAVRQLLAEHFGIEVSVWTVGRYLRRWGFTPQKPLRRAYEQNPKAVQRWLEEEYPAIQELARRENAEIHWGDEMGLRSTHQAGRSYGRRGATPVIPGTGQRFGCNLISTITNRGRLAFMVFREHFSARVLIAFLRRLLRNSVRKVFVILDRHPVHLAEAVEQWAAKWSDRLRLLFLPSYSPELNPDESLNNDVKGDALGRHRPHNEAEMLKQLRSHLRSRQHSPKIIQRYFHGKSVAYAAA